MAVNAKILFEYPVYPPYFREERLVLCDSEGNRQTVPRSKMELAVLKGKLNLVSEFKSGNAGRSFRQYEAYRARQKLTGAIIDDFEIVGNRILLKRVYLRNGTYTIPEFVSGIYWAAFPQSPFYECEDLTVYNASSMTSFEYLFLNCHNLVHLDLSKFDTSKVIIMKEMFSGCDALRELDVSGFNTSKVVTMHCMFNHCKSLKSLRLRNFNTAQVADMSGMFHCCRDLVDIDVSNFDIRAVFSMDNMFSTSPSLWHLDLSSFARNTCCDFHSMFQGCSNLSWLDMHNMPMLRKADVDSIFRGCPENGEFMVHSSAKSRVLYPNGW